MDIGQGDEFVGGVGQGRIAGAEADGIDYLFARSTQGKSTIEAHMELNYDANAAVAEIQAKVASQRNVLPAEADDPVIDSVTGDVTALMYLAFYSDTMSPSQITDYLLRVAQRLIRPDSARIVVVGPAESIEAPLAEMLEKFGAKAKFDKQGNLTEADFRETALDDGVDPHVMWVTPSTFAGKVAKWSLSGSLADKLGLGNE